MHFCRRSPSFCTNAGTTHVNNSPHLINFKIFFHLFVVWRMFSTYASTTTMDMRKNNHMWYNLCTFLGKLLCTFRFLKNVVTSTFCRTLVPMTDHDSPTIQLISARSTAIVGQSTIEFCFACILCTSSEYILIVGTR